MVERLRPSDPHARRQVGLVEVVLVGAAVVAVVLGAAVLTGLLPAPLQRLVFETPLLIAILIGGTALMLWRVARRPAR